MQSTCTSLILTNQLKSGILISERCRVCWVLLETDGWNMEQCYTYCVHMFRSTTRVTAYHVENLISAKNFGEGGKSCTSLDDDETWINTKSEYDANWKPAEWGGGGGFLFTCTNCCFYSLVFSFCFVIIWLPILASPFSFFQMTSSPAVVEFRHHAADYIAKLIKVSTIIAFKPL